MAEPPIPRYRIFAMPSVLNRILLFSNSFLLSLICSGNFFRKFLKFDLSTEYMTDLFLPRYERGDEWYQETEDARV
jgi:hypothetical protein